MSAIDYTKKLIPADDVLVRELEGEAVILHLGDESYYGLNESGTRMWQLLITSATIEASLKTLLEEFDVEEETLKKDLSQLIHSLVERKMATIT
jgi:hypothetical protein